MTIKKLYDQELKYWRNKNISLFGVDLIDENKPFNEIQQELKDSCDKYWNVEKPCKLARYLNSGKLDHDAEKKIKNSYVLELNYYNFCIDVYASYKDKNGECSQYKVCAIPTPSTDLTWIINNAHYVPRITAVRDDNSLVRKQSYDTVRGEFWTYNLETKNFTCVLKKEPFKTDITTIFNEHLSPRSKALLQSCISKKLTEDTFEEALSKLPLIKKNSIFNYKFSRVEYFEDIIFNSRKYAQPLKKILLGINNMIVSQAKQYTTSGEYLEGSLILSTSPIFSLENFRAVINVYNGDFKPAFTYTDTVGFFDSFKTATTPEAGRRRLLLDNIIVKDGMLWIKHKNGKETNMFEMMNNPQNLRLSCISSSLFCNNNKAKRIMMTGKLTTQAVPLQDEIDSISHRMRTRVGFIDIEGYTYGDSIIISRSLADKLRTYEKKIIRLKTDDKVYKELKAKYDENRDYILDFYDLKKLFPLKNSAIIDSYENAKVDLFDMVNEHHCRLFLSWEVPFSLGDKISNLHAAKGVVSRILPDEEMPTLTKKVGNMEPGPLEIIISGFSVIRRGSLGQIFEAWANASGIEFEENEDFISLASEKYIDQMKEYSKNSIVSYKGEKIIAPVGLMEIMRLNHHACTHVSISPVDGDFNKMLRLGEMEKFNLLANDCTSILKELSIRSIHKYIGSRRLVEDMWYDRSLPEHTTLSLKFAQLLKSVGYSINLDGKPLVPSDLSSVEISEADESVFAK